MTYYINVYETSRNDHYTISYDTLAEVEADRRLITKSDVLNHEYLHTIHVDGQDVEMLDLAEGAAS